MCPDSASWRDHWFPLAFSRDLDSSGPQRFTVFDHGFAVFRDESSAVRAVADRCPHRGARLSDGSVCEGRIECLYHGWRFSGDGRCVEIPQLARDQAMPSRAHVAPFAVAEVQGIVWLWPGDESAADPSAIPTLYDLDRDDDHGTGTHCIDFAIDLPYEQTFLVENVVDIAHIHVAHHGVRGGGDRSLAAPLAFEISDLEPEGFHASFRSRELSPELFGVELDDARVDFRAPNLVHYRSVYADDDLCSGLALYSCPTGRGRCRLLYRAYSNFMRLRDRLRPRWWEHGTQCRILEQDLNVVCGQVEEIQTSGLPPREMWLPLKSSDAAVLAYRRWLDRFADAWPYEVGFSTVRTVGATAGTLTSPAPPTPSVLDRDGLSLRSMHTRSCSSCRSADRLLRFSGRPLELAALGLVAAAAVASSLGASPTWVVGLAATGLAAAGLRAAASRLLRRFR